MDVQLDEAGRVWHVLAEDVPGVAPLEAEIDWTRRFEHMQQHTGQHMLSAAFERELGAETLSSHLGEERSSIEVRLTDVDWRAVERLERILNGIVWEDREVVRHWVDEEGVKRFPLRKPPQVRGRIRIVEIPDWDVSACGGTAHAAHRRGRDRQDTEVGAGARKPALRVPVRWARAARLRVARGDAARGGAPAHAQGRRAD